METRRARGRVCARCRAISICWSPQDVHDRDLTERMFTTTLPWTVGLILVLA